LVIANAAATMPVTAKVLNAFIMMIVSILQADEPVVAPLSAGSWELLQVIKYIGCRSASAPVRLQKILSNFRSNRPSKRIDAGKMCRARMRH
jgi:hypothetical protein